MAIAGTSDWRNELRKQVINFAKCEDLVFTFPPMPPEQRAYIHRLARQFGITSKSYGKGDKRQVTLSVKQRDAFASLKLEQHVFPHAGRSLWALVASYGSSAFELTEGQLQKILSELKADPLTEEERQFLLPGHTLSFDSKFRRNWGNKLSFTNKKPIIPRVKSRGPKERERCALPVYGRRAEILSTVEQNQVVLISGETGCGKTTQVAQYIMEKCARDSLPCRVVITQPRRLPAVTVADRVCSELGENEVGETVGYHIRLDKKYSRRTVLTFCTSGILLRSLGDGDSFLRSCTHIILDEIHERDMVTDFVLTVLKSVISRYPALRLILMSATMERDKQLFKDFFGGAADITVGRTVHEVTEFFLEEILEVSGYECPKGRKFGETTDEETGSFTWKPTFSGVEWQKEDDIKNTSVPVDEEWWDDDDLEAVAAPLYVNKQKAEDWEPDVIVLEESDSELENEVQERVEGKEDDVSSESSECVFGRKRCDSFQCNKEEENPYLMDYYRWHDKDSTSLDVDLLYSLLLKLLDSCHEGSILVFLPGYEDIMAVKDKFEGDETLVQYKMTPDIHILHSQMMNWNDRSLFLPAAKNHRKIILSTNIAEASITIDDVVIVVDSGLAKERFYDPFRNISMLRQIWISKSSATQRMGRAGRCRPGLCYRLYSRSKASSLIPAPVPEMKRTEIHQLCLQSKLVAPEGVSITDFLLGAPDPPETDVLKNAIKFLKLIEALDEQEEMTELGRILCDMPLTPQLALLLLNGIFLRCFDSVLSIVAALSYRDPFQLPGDMDVRERVEKARRSLAGENYSDHYLLLRIVEEFEIAKRKGDRQAKAVCGRYHLSRASMDMIVGIKEQLQSEIFKSGLIRQEEKEKMNEYSLNMAVIKAALAAAAFPNIGKIEKEKKARISTAQDGSSLLFPGSMVHHQLREKNLNSGKSRANLHKSPSSYLVYQERTQLESGIYLKNVTVVSACAVSLLSGPSRLREDVLEEALNDQIDGMSQNVGFEFKSGDWPMQYNVLVLADWLAMKIPRQTCASVTKLRLKWKSLFLRKLSSAHVLDRTQEDEVLKAIVDLLVSEEEKLGLKNPEEFSKRRSAKKPGSQPSFSLYKKRIPSQNYGHSSPASVQSVSRPSVVKTSDAVYRLPSPCFVPYGQPHHYTYPSGISSMNMMGIGRQNVFHLSNNGANDFSSCPSNGQPYQFQYPQICFRSNTNEEFSVRCME